MNRYGCIYRTDDDNTTFLFRNIATGDRKVIVDLLVLLEADLLTIQHFFRYHPCYADYWYTEPVLVAFGIEDVAAVRAMSVGLLAWPEEMAGRRGLLVLLKEDPTSAEVLWLSTRSAGADRRIAAIVDRIYENGGEMKWTQAQGDPKMTMFEMLARRCFPLLWLRLYRLCGRLLLGSKDLAMQIIDMCQYRNYTPHAKNHSSARIAYFVFLCRYLGGLSWNVLLMDADYNEVLAKALSTDYLIFKELFADMAKFRSAVLKTKYEDMCYTLFNTPCADGSPLIDRVFENPDITVALQLFELVADMKAFRDWHRPISKLIEHFVPPPSDQIRLMRRFGEFLQDTENFQLLPQLISNNWVTAVRHLTYQDRSRMLNLSEAHQESLFDLCIEQEFLPMLHFMVSVINVPRNRLNSLMIKFVACHNVCDTMLFEKWAPKRWEDGQLADVICSALRNCLFANYRGLDAWRMANAVDVKDLVDSSGENLLFCSIFNKAPILDDYSSERYWENDIQDNISAEDNLNKIFDELITNRVDVHHVNMKGQNLAHLAVQGNNLHILDKLVQHGVDIRLPDHEGNRPMHYARCSALIKALPRDDLQAPNNRQETPMLRYMSMTGQGQSTQLIFNFIKFGSDPAARASCGNGLHLVEKNGELVQYFLEAGCDVNERNERGETAAYYALIGRRSYEVRRLLLGNPDADLLATCCDGKKSVLQGLVDLGDAQMNQLLPFLDANQMNRLFAANCQLTYNSSRPSNSYCRRRLMETPELDVGAVDYPDSKYYKHQERWLLELGANVRVRSRKEPIVWSQQEVEGDYDRDRNGRLDFLKDLQVLIKWGLSMEVVNSDGSNAIDLYMSPSRASSKECVQVLALLIKAGFDYRRQMEYLENTIFKCLFEWDD